MILFSYRDDRSRTVEWHFEKEYRCVIRAEINATIMAGSGIDRDPTEAYRIAWLNLREWVKKSTGVEL